MFVRFDKEVMAFIDDRDWLISHIRHCFVTSDETGLCERVVAPDEKWDRILDGRYGTNDVSGFARFSSFLNVENEPDDTSSSSFSSNDPFGSSFNDTEGSSASPPPLPNSFDIHFGLQYGSSKFKKTSIDSEKLYSSPRHPQKTVKKGDKILSDGSDGTSKRRNVSWRQTESGIPYDPETMGHMFEKKPVGPSGKFGPAMENPPSSLSNLMASVADLPTDPFFSFAQFDGASHSGIPVKHIAIFLMMCSGQDRWVPMRTTVRCSARVADLIGLVCHRYVQERRSPELNNVRVDGYALYIADDDGEVDDDIPPLDAGEPITKFDFTSLALVEKETPMASEVRPTIVTVNIPQSGWHKFQVENDEVPMLEILKISLQRRRKKEGRGIEYLLEKQREPGVPVELEKPLKEMDTLEFCLIRVNSARGDEERVEEETTPDVDSRIESVLPPEMLVGMLPPQANRRYKVSIVKKFKANTDAHLDVDGERIEISPIPNPSGSSTTKPLTLDLQCLVDANIIEEKSAKGKATFRIRYQPSTGTSEAQPKHIDLKCVSIFAREIVDHVNAILDFRSGTGSVARMREKQRDRKTGNKRHSLLP